MEVTGMHEVARVLWQHAASVQRRYGATTLGSNTWTMPALAAALWVYPWVERAANAVAASISSMYRCAAVNAAAGGVPDSLHVQGRAVDIVPGGSWNLETAFTHLRAMAKELGPLRTIIIEQRHLHLDWHAADSAENPQPRFFRKVGQRYIPEGRA